MSTPKRPCTNSDVGKPCRDAPSLRFLAPTQPCILSALCNQESLAAENSPCCFKNRLAQEFSLTLRPDLEASGDFVVTDSPASLYASRILHRSVYK